MRYVVRDGLDPLPGIGPGPLEEADYLAREERYMRQFEAGSPTPRDRRVYVPEGEGAGARAERARRSTRAGTRRRARSGAAETVARAQGQTATADEAGDGAAGARDTEA